MANAAEIQAGIQLSQAQSAEKSQATTHQIANQDSAAFSQRLSSEASWRAAQTRANGKDNGIDKVTRRLIENVDTGTSTVRKSLRRAIEIIKRSSTKEFTGPDQQLLQQALNDYATAAAKVADPTTGVKEAEQARELESLGVVPGEVFNTDSTVLTLLQSALNNSEERRKTSYKEHGLAKHTSHALKRMTSNGEPMGDA